MTEICFLTNLTSSEWASWIQAIGSILAIVGAFLVGDRTASASLAQAEKIRIAAVRAKYAAVKACLDDGFQICLDLKADWLDAVAGRRTTLFLRYDREIFLECLDILKTVPLFDLASADLVKYVVEFKRSLAAIQTFVEGAKTNGWPDDGQAEYEMSSYWENVALKNATDVYFKAITITGGDAPTTARPFGYEL